MASTNSFDAHGTLEVGEQSYEIYRLAAVEGSASLPYSLKVLLENLLRTEDGAQHHRRPRPRRRGLGPRGAARHRDPVHAGARHHAGLHRSPVRRRPRHDARGRRRARWRRHEGQPARPGRARHRPLGDHRRLRSRRRLRAQRRDRVPAQRGALQVPSLGADRLRRLQGRPTRHRHRAPGQHRAPGPHRHGPRRRRLPGHLRRHRQPHDDGQRSRGPRVGRRRHRGRGGDARPAGLHAHPARRGLQALRLDPAGGHRHRRRPDDHRDAAPATGSSASSSSSTARGCRRSRSPTGRPSAT